MGFHICLKLLIIKFHCNKRSHRLNSVLFESTKHGAHDCSVQFPVFDVLRVVVS